MLETISGLLHSAIELLRVAPFWVWILALILLPAVGFPVSPLWILAGGVWGRETALFLVFPCAVIAMTAAFYAARKLLEWRQLAWVAEKFRKFEGQANLNARTLVLLIRLAPGVPFALQNALLAAANVRFDTFLLYSAPVVLAYNIGFIWLGSALLEGQIGLALFAAFGLIVVSLLARKFYSRMKATQPKHP